MNISIKQTSEGPVLNFKGENFSVKYPQNIWINLPEDFRRFFLDNYIFLKSVHLPLMFKETKVNLNTNYPLLKSFISFIYTMSAPSIGDANGLSTEDCFKLLNDSIFRFKGFEIKRPNIDLHKLNESCVMSFSFGKDSLFNFSIAREIGLEIHPIWVMERGAPLENEFKEKMCIPFEKEFGVKIEKLKNETMVLHDYRYFNLKSDLDYIVSHLMTEYAFLMLPYMINYKSKMMVFGNEQSCNFTYINRDGYTCYPEFDQTVVWMKELNNILNMVFNTELNVVSFVEPLHDISITKILHERYPEIGKYQYSCFPDLTEGNKYDRWCCNCSKCARLYIIFKALGIDTKKLGFEEDMLSKYHMKYYPIFNKSNDNAYDRSGVGKDEQMLAFLLASENGVKGYLIDYFKKKFFKDVKKREDELRRMFFGIHTFETIPKKYKKKLRSIFKEELSGLW
ncbi:MAG: hypothetical protein QXY45_01005 [Candidatus Aenigmatarchaeota archaeon]